MLEEELINYEDLEKSQAKLDEIFNKNYFLDVELPKIIEEKNNEKTKNAKKKT